MALTANHRHYTNTSSTISTYPNYSSHRTNDLLLPLPSKSSTMDVLSSSSSSKHAWLDFIPDSSAKSIKDEIFDFEITEMPSLQTNHIDYTIINSNIDPLDSKIPHLMEKKSSDKSNIKNKKTETIKRK